MNLFKNRELSDSIIRIATMDSKEIYRKVQENYSAVAKTARGKNADVIAKAFGYTTNELANIPVDANLGLSCGNPLALSKLREVCSTCVLHNRACYLILNIGGRGRRSSI